MSQDTVHEEIEIVKTIKMLQDYEKKSRSSSPASSWKTCDYVVFQALNNWSQVSPLILDQSPLPYKKREDKERFILV